MDRQTEATIPVLRAALKNPICARQAAQFLGAMGLDAQAAVPDLIEAVRQDVYGTDQARALGRMGRTGLIALNELLADEDPRIRQAASAAYFEVDSDLDIVLPAMIHAQKDDDNGIRDNTFGVLYEHRDDAIPQLVKALADPDPDRRKIAVGALARLRPPAREAIPALRLMLDHENAMLREVVAEALRQIEPEGPAQPAVK